jgi:hypothetical protein
LLPKKKNYPVSARYLEEYTADVANFDGLGYRIIAAGVCYEGTVKADIHT